jgi:TctA family transporter
VPRSSIAVRRTLSLLGVAFIASKLGEMSVSFTGNQWAWMTVPALLIALSFASFDLLHAIWSTERM